MNVNIYRIDNTLPLPKYETAGAAGFDLICRESSEIKAGSIALIPANIIIEVPEGYMLAVLPRSSTPKKGLMLANSLGVIDNDYCGPEDEVKILVYNFTEKTVTVNRGDRIAQAIFVRIECVEFCERQIPPSNVTRSGFGSTG